MRAWAAREANFFGVWHRCGRGEGAEVQDLFKKWANKFAMYSPDKFKKPFLYKLWLGSLEKRKSAKVSIFELAPQA